MTSQVAQLNDAVRSATLGGDRPNDLADQRDLLVTRIAEATGAVATPGDGGVVNLTLGGRTLVTGIHSAAAAGRRADRATRRAAGTVAVGWVGSDQTGDRRQRRPVRSADGRQRHDPRDDVGPGHRRRLLADKRQHPAGAGVRPVNGAAGGAILAGTTAATLRVVMTDQAGVAASAGPPPALDGGNALAMGRYATGAKGPDALYRDMTVGSGCGPERPAPGRDAVGGHGPRRRAPATASLRSASTRR